MGTFIGMRNVMDIFVGMQKVMSTFVRMRKLMSTYFGRFGSPPIKIL